MSAIPIKQTVHINKPSLSMENAFLDPLRFCGRQWQKIRNSDMDNSLKVVGVGACTVMLTLATALAFIPGIIGSIALSCSDKRHPSSIETWRITLQEGTPLKDRCKQIHDIAKVDTISTGGCPEVSRKVIQNLNRFRNILLISSVGTRRNIINQRNVIDISLTLFSNSFFDNLARCFNQHHTDADTVQALVNTVFGNICSADESFFKAFPLQKMPASNKINIRIPENLKHLEIRISILG
jgi:hypothetical protein